MRQRFNQAVYILFVGCIVTLYVSINKCRNNATNYTQSKNYISSLGDTITYLKNGIAQKLAIEVNKDLFKELLEKNEFLTRMLKDAKIKAGDVKQSTKIITIIKSDTIEIPILDTIPCPEFKPVAFNVDSVHYSIGGLISKHSISIGKINFPDSLYVITASKSHFFRKDEYLVSVKHSNPYIRTVGLTNLTVTQERKWWDAWYVKAGAGFVAGSYLTYKLSR